MKYKSFKDWEANKNSNPKTAVTEDSISMDGAKSNAEILAEITSLKEKKGLAAKNKSAYDHQIHEIDIQLLELELDRNRLSAKKKELAEAADIAKSKKVKDGRQQEAEKE